MVGGGMTGLSCAQKLAEGGLKVLLLEKKLCGGEASGKSSGFITPDSEIELSSLISHHGPEKAKRIWNFVMSGVDLIRSNIERYGIDCDYQIQDSLFIANSKRGWRHVKHEHEARKALFYASHLIEADDLTEIIGSKKYRGAVRYSDTFGFISHRYCRALMKIFMAAGVKIYEKTPVTKILADGVETKKGRFYASQIIVCADRFIPDLGHLKKEIYHIQTFIGISKPLSDADVKKVFPGDPLMVWDSSMIYNYFRLTPDKRLILGGGHLLHTYSKKPLKNLDKIKRKLLRQFSKNFPGISVELKKTYSGMLGVSRDLLPVMGEDKHMKNVWYVGAATGLPWAAALGKYAAERITKNRTGFEEDFSWRRPFPLPRFLEFLVGKKISYALSHFIAKYL